MKLVLAVLVVLTALAVDAFEFQRHLSTKSPYFPLSNSSLWTPPPPGCYPAYLNFLARHGARNPSGGDISQLKKLHEKLEKHMDTLPDTPSIQWIRNWTSPYNKHQSSDLQPPGELQMYELGKRMRHNYPEIFDVPDNIAPDVAVIRTTTVERTSRSGNSWAVGMFEGRGELGPGKMRSYFSFSVPKEIDYELRFFDTCPNFVSGVLENTTTYQQADLYLDYHLEQLRHRLSPQLGFNISAEYADIIWKACAWEVALHNITDKWCALFQREDFEMFEYREDLKFFYESGYGTKDSLGFEIACPLLKSMVDLFDMKINGSEELRLERARMRFAHAETLVPLLTLLGLYNDSVTLTADSPPEVIQSRTWRSSQFTSFGSNFVFLLYNCTEAQDGGGPWRVKLFHNEKEYHQPECENRLLCDYDDFKNIYERQDLACNYKELCGLDQQPAVAPAEALDMTKLGVLVGSISIFVGILFGFIIGWQGKAYQQKRATNYDNLGD